MQKYLTNKSIDSTVKDLNYENISISYLQSLSFRDKKDVINKETLPLFLAKVLKRNDLVLLSYLVKCHKDKEFIPIYIEFLFQCCEIGKKDLIKLMLEEKIINVNVQNNYGETPLHIIASKGEINCIKLLISFKPDKTIKTKEGLLPYDYALEQGNEEIIRLLQVPELIWKNRKLFDKISINLSNEVDQGNKRYCFTDRDNDEKTLGIVEKNKNDEDFKVEENENCSCTYSKNHASKIKVYTDFCKSDEEEEGKDISEPNESESKEEEIVKSIVDPFVQQNMNDKYKNCNINTGNSLLSKKYADLFEFDTETYNDEDYEHVTFFSNNNTKNRENKDEEDQITNILKNQLTISLDKSYPQKSKKEIELKTGNVREKNNNYNQHFSDSITNVHESKEQYNTKDTINQLPASFIFSPSKTKANSYIGKQIDTEETVNIIDINNIIYQKSSLTSGPASNTETKLVDSNLTDPNALMLSFLKEIGLQHYAKLLVDNGFNDISLLIEQTKNALAISDKNLLDIGIIPPGERAKILIRIEEKAKLFNFPLEKEKIYMKSTRNQNNLYRMLSNIKLENLLTNFIDGGYISPDLLYIQMLTRQPITEGVLKEIGIDKIGFRMRILNKLKTESQIYGNKCNRNSVTFETKRNEEFCNLCKVF